MKRILLTGMSGTGKSTIITRLIELGCTAVDLDSDAYSEWVTVLGDEDTVAPGQDWVWREDRVQDLLSTQDTDLLFVSGCASNMGKFLTLFDQVILLSAPPDIIVDRLVTRTNNPYGKRAGEVTRVLGLIETIEPRLRLIAQQEIDTSAPLDAVAAAILRVAKA